MKKLFSLIILTLVLISCNKNNAENEVDMQRKKISQLNIQFIKTYEYEYRFGMPDSSTAFLIQNEEYDKKGNLIKLNTYNRNPNMIEFNEEILYTYNSEGYCVKSICKNDPSYTVIEASIYSDTLKYASPIKSIVVNKYDKTLNTERIFYTANGELERKVIYQYDKNKNVVEHVTYDSIGHIDGKVVTKYNSGNEEITETIYGKDGKITSSTKISQLTDNSKEYLTFNDKGELEYKYTTIMNKDNQVVESSWYSVKDNTSEKTINKYDKDKLISETILYDCNGEPKYFRKIEKIRFK